MSKPPPEIVEVEIFDQRYALRLASAAERDEIRWIAEALDRRMRDIAEQTGTIDSLKVAVLTALHLAQEKQDRDRRDEELESAVTDGARKWIREIDSLLNPSATDSTD